MVNREQQPSEATLLALIAACRNATLPGARLSLYIGTAPIGYIKPDLADALATFTTRTEAIVTIPAENAAALNDIATTLAPRLGYRLRGELFDVRSTPDGPVLTTLDRGALPAFGITGVGVHLNGYVRRSNGLHLWIARRSPTKKLDPDKLDNMVGGGVSAGMTPHQTLIKEAAEEAAIPRDLVTQATETAQIRYDMDRPEGLRRDLLHCYDLELPEIFIPRAADGEVASFTLHPAATIPKLLGADVKFNVNLVLIDFLIRHRIIADPAGKVGLALRHQAVLF